ncbi:MAG: hypothetical protein ACREQW_02690 [Candidatus Binatia bacterium]
MFPSVRKALPLLLCLALTLFDFVFSKPPGTIHGSDDIFYFIYLPSIVVDRDLDFANQLQKFRASRDDNVLDNVPVSPNGRIINRYGLGYALLSVPFFLLGFPGAFLARAFGISWSYDGMNPIFQFSTTLASVVWGFVGLDLCRRLLQRHFTHVAARRATWMTFWATPLVYYVCLTPTMAHASAFFAAALWLYVWDRRTPDLPLRQAMVLGAAGALAFLVRYSHLLVWLGALLDWFRWRSERPAGLTFGHWLRFWFVAVLTFLVCIVPQLWAWDILFGQALVNPYRRSDLFAYWISPRFEEVLFSDLRGLFNWHPILFFAAVGLIVSLSRQRWLASYSIVVLAGFIYLQASYTLSLGVSFGNRVFVDALPFFAVGLAAFLSAGPWQGLRWGLCLCLVFLNLVLALSYRFQPTSEGASSWPQRLARAGKVPAEAMARVQEIIPRFKSPS